MEPGGDTGEQQVHMYEHEHVCLYMSIYNYGDIITLCISKSRGLLCVCLCMTVHMRLPQLRNSKNRVFL